MSTKVYEGFILADKWNDGKIETFEKFCNEIKLIFATLYHHEKGTKYKIYDQRHIDLFINTIQKYFPEIYYKTKTVQVRNSFFTQYETRIFCELDIDNKYWQRKDYKDKLIGLLRLEGILKVKES